MCIKQWVFTKTSWRQSLQRRDSTISHSSKGPWTEGPFHQWERPVVSLRQKEIKLQRKETQGGGVVGVGGGGGKNEQPSRSNHPQPKPSPVQSAIESVYQELDAAGTNFLSGHARADPKLSHFPCLWGLSHHHHHVRSVATILHIRSTLKPIQCLNTICCQ